MSTLAPKHVHFAGLTWKEEEARSSRGQSQRRTRKIRKKDPQRLDKMSDNGGLSKSKEKRTKKAWDLLKHPKLVESLAAIFSHSKEKLAFLLLQIFLTAGMGLDVSKDTPIERALELFRDDETEYSDLTITQKQLLLSFWNEKAIRNFFFTDSEDRNAFNAVLGTEEWWNLQMPGLREKICGLPDDVLKATREFSVEFDRAMDNAAAAATPTSVAPTASRDDESETTVDPKSSDEKKEPGVAAAASVPREAIPAGSHGEGGGKSGKSSIGAAGHQDPAGKRKNTLSSKTKKKRAASMENAVCGTSMSAAVWGCCAAAMSASNARVSAAAACSSMVLNATSPS